MCVLVLTWHKSALLSEDLSNRLLKEKRKRILKDFAETTSAHGCALVSKSSNLFKRSFWITAIRHMTNITFPAVTICNLNPIRSSWLVKSEFSLTLLDELKKTARLLKEQEIGFRC
uniref:Uncharacterized protein n=1 Tax=Parascaris equorum TaxID=6256 RepID=A0A914RZU7_PAREQ